MNDFPKITVITTTYNLYSDGREELFKKCCESVHNQTYSNIEHIVMDGGSEDDTLKLIKKLAASMKFKYYVKADNGIDEGYNNALAHATGKYVFFMNSDDQYYSNDVLEKCVEIMEKKNADYCYGSERQYTREGKFVFEWRPNISQFFHNVPYPHATLGCRRDVLAKLGNYNTDFGYGGDYYLMIQLILNDYKGVEIPLIISRYILGGISSQQKDLKKQYQTFIILSERIKFVAQQFFPSITWEECWNIYHFAKNTSKAFPKDFLLKLIRFMIDKKLKNFDYNSFINYVNLLSSDHEEVNSLNDLNRKMDIRLFGFLPFIKMKRKNKKILVYLLGFIPFLKIKTK